MTVGVLVLVVAAIAGAGVGWRLHANAQLAAVSAMVALLAVVAVLVLWAGEPGAWGTGASRALLVLLAVLAVTGGGPLAVAVLRLADREAPTPARPPQDGEVLRGGAWIGSLERAGIFAALVAGWPEGVAVVLAVKGIGRYPELGAPGAAERFIIGTFASVLWAAGCAGLWWFGWPWLGPEHG